MIGLIPDQAFLLMGIHFLNTQIKILNSDITVEPVLLLKIDVGCSIPALTPGTIFEIICLFMILRILSLGSSENYKQIKNGRIIQFGSDHKGKSKTKQKENKQNKQRSTTLVILQQISN